MKKINCVFPYACAASLALAAGSLQAQISISAGETVLFQDSFDNNDNGWSNIGTTDSSASISGGFWTPYAPVSGEAVNSSASFDTAINLADGDVSVYFSASVVNRYSNERFGVNLTDENSQAGFVIQAGTSGNGYFTYTTVSDSNANQWNSDLSPTFIVNTGFLDYKLTISANGQDGSGTDIYSATFLVYGYDDGTGNDYGVVYTMSQDMYFEGGMMDELSLYVRNQGATVKFDEVVVTQIPEPSTTGLLLGLAGLSLIAVRRRRG
jgi:hypothetical protein